MAEAQGDVTIRGGIFENTGFRVGSATLIDPQTGHYSAELPIAPEMLTAPKVLVAGDNALYGFNSTVGTISYGWSQIQDGGSATLGGGDHDLNFQRLHHAVTGTFANAEDWSWGAEVETSRSESDGTIQYGDHNFDRTTGRVQLVGPNSQTDFFAGYQSKFFAWPNMYTTDGVHETENLKTSLFMINHKQSYDDRSFIEGTAYYREHKDNYIYSRENPQWYDARHTTYVTSLGFSGLHAWNDQYGLNYSAQIAADEINSNKLEDNSRTAAKLILLPEYQMEMHDGESVTVRIGGSFDDTNRDDSKFSGICDLTWEHRENDNHFESLYISYVETSQIAGYTAIAASSGGPFASNSDLDCETTQNLELGGSLNRDTWTFEGALFYRWDDDLVDWTYSENDTSARSAKGVDIETFGIELIASKRWNSVEAIASYTFLDKDEDYGDDSIDASFYALNYAKHRITLGAAVIKAKGAPSGNIWIGFALMQLAGLAFAYGQVAYRDWKRLHTQTNDRDGFALLYIGGTVCAGIFSLSLTDWSALEISVSQWQALLYLGCIASGLGFFLWNKGAARSNPGTLAAFNNAVVPLAVICSLFIFGEITNSDTETLIRLFICAALIGAAVMLGQKKTA